MCHLTVYNVFALFFSSCFDPNEYAPLMYWIRLLFNADNLAPPLKAIWMCINFNPKNRIAFTRTKNIDVVD